MTNNINNLDNLLYLISENPKLYFDAPEDSPILYPIREAFGETKGLAYGLLFKVRNKPFGFLKNDSHSGDIFVYEDKYNGIHDGVHCFGRFIDGNKGKKATQLLLITHENLVKLVGETKADEVVAECFERYQEEIDTITKREARRKEMELENLRKAEELNQKLFEVFGFREVEKKLTYHNGLRGTREYRFFFPRKMTKEEVTMYADMIGLKTIPEVIAAPVCQEEIEIKETSWYGENVWEYHHAPTYYD